MRLHFLPSLVQRRRQRERRFYLLLAASCLLGALPVLYLSSLQQIEYRRTTFGNHLLEAELKAMAPLLNEHAKATADIRTMRNRMAAVTAMASQREEALLILHALGTIDMHGIHLHGLTLRQHHLQLQAYADNQADITRFSAALADTNLGHAALQDMRPADAGGSTRYDVAFTLALPGHTAPKEVR